MSKQDGVTGRWLTLLVLSCVLAVAVPAVAESVDQVTNPRAASGGWVSDMAGVISSDVEQKLNSLIAGLERETSAEIAVVTVRSTGGVSPKEFATELLNRWGVGKKGQDNGVLILLVMDARRVEVETGYGVEGVLPDGKVGEILDTYVIPQFRRGDFGAGLYEGTRAIAAVLGGAGAAAGQGGAAPVVPKGRHREETGAVGGLLQFLLLLVPVPVIAWLVVRSRIRKCPQCGKPMRKLTEEQEDAYLTFEQKVEDDLGAVPHHVWRCDDCQVHTVERGWRSWAYSDCPKCHHHTMVATSRVVRPPTYSHTGESVTNYQCRFPGCDYRRVERHTIPKLVRPTTYPGGRRYGGGGFSSGGFFGGGFSSGGGFSGSFGGGGSGGGGAGRSW